MKDCDCAAEKNLPPSSARPVYNAKDSSDIPTLTFGPWASFITLLGLALRCKSVARAYPT